MTLLAFAGLLSAACTAPVRTDNAPADSGRGSAPAPSAAPVAASTAVVVPVAAPELPQAHPPSAPPAAPRSTPPSTPSAAPPAAPTRAVPPDAPPVYHGSRTARLVALFVNVDWGKDEFAQLLPILRQHEARVTFFVSGKWAAQNPDLLHKAMSDGHEIASHGHDLQFGPFQLLQEGKLHDDIAMSVRTIAGITAVPVRYWSPHMSEISAAVARTASSLNLYTIMYTVDTIDWRADATPELIYQRTLRAQSGDFVLMHPMRHTVTALPRILTGLREKSLRAVTLTQVLAAGGTVVPAP